MIRLLPSFLMYGSALWLLFSPLYATESPTAKAGKPAPEASIPFANRGGIRDWQLEDDSTLLLQDRRGQWYRAKLQVPAYYLSYAEAIGFVTGPSGTLEKFGSVVIRGQRYPIISLTRIKPPAKKQD